MNLRDCMDVLAVTGDAPDTVEVAEARAALALRLIEVAMDELSVPEPSPNPSVAS